MSNLALTRRYVLQNGLSAGAALLVPNLCLSKESDGLFVLRAQRMTYKFDKSDLESTLWVYNSQTPGPEIRVVKGTRVKVKFTNALDVPTTIHWHGIRISNSMDGVSGLTQEPIPPGHSFIYDFVVPDAGTFWYHAHHKSWQQVARGLYGPLIVDEPEVAIDPTKDITLIVDDWWLDAGGKQHNNFDDYMNEKQGGRIGNYTTINGEPPGKTMDVIAGQPYRLRLINTANARIFQLQFSGPESKMIARDGQTLDYPLPIPDGAIELAPGQRVDLIFVPTPGKTIALTDKDGFVEPESDDVKFTLLSFRSKGEDQKVPVPTILPNQLAQPQIEVARKASIVMEGGAVGGLNSAEFNGVLMGRDELVQNRQVWTFNGVANLPVKPLFSVAASQTVIVTLDNRTGWQHAMHVHGHHFQILDPNGTSAIPIWYDTYLVDRLSKVQLVFVANNPGKWLIHCHMLQHAVAGMNTWFEVS